jgi:uncharacterized protein (TIGR02284 family)
MDSPRQSLRENKSLVAPLRELFQALCVSQNALLEIAGKTADENIARMLYELALARGKLAIELRPFVEANCPPSSEGHLLTELNEIGQRIQSALLGNDTYVVLSDLEELEALILRSVRRVVAATQGHQVQKVLQRQFDHMQRSYESVQDLRDISKGRDRFRNVLNPRRFPFPNETGSSGKKTYHKGENHELGSN